VPKWLAFNIQFGLGKSKKTAVHCYLKTDTLMVRGSL
jgi:hypothetical protein